MARLQGSSNPNTGVAVILEAFDNISGLEATNAHTRRKGQQLAGNNSFYPTSLGTAPVIFQKDGRKLRRVQVTGAPAFNGGLYSDVYGAPLAQRLSAAVPSRMRPYRRYIFEATVQLDAIPANGFFEIGWRTNASRLETNPTTWGVVAAIRDGGTWQSVGRLASGGAAVVGAASGLSGLVPSRITCQYLEGPVGTFTIAVNGTTIYTADADAELPVVADGTTVNVFGCSFGGYSPGGVTFNGDVWDSYYKVEEIG